MNTNRRSVFMASMAAIIVSMAPSTASAILGRGRIVYDPANHVENIITAIKTTLSLIENIKTNMNQQAILETFAASPEMKEMLEMLDSANSIYAALKDSKKVMENLANTFGASPYDNWQDFVANIEKRKEAGDKQAQMLYDSAFAADKQVRLAHVASKNIQAGVKGVKGPTEAVQAAVNAIGVVIDQNNNMLYAMSAANKMQGQELERQATEREQYEKTVKRYKESVKKANEYDQEQLKKAGLGSMRSND